MRRPLGGFIVDRQPRQAVELIVPAGREQQHQTGLQLEKIMAKLEELLDAVASQQTQIDSLIALTEGLHTQVIAAMGSTITPSQQMRIDQVFAQVGDNANDIAAAIKENTVEASSGAISDGPGLAEIRGSAGGTISGVPVGDAPAGSAGLGNADPGPAVGDALTEPQTSGT